MVVDDFGGGEVNEQFILHYGNQKEVYISSVRQQTKLKGENVTCGPSHWWYAEIGS